MISQEEVEKIYNAKNKIKELEKMVEDCERVLIERLKSGESCSYGALEPTVIDRKSKRPSWKNSFIQYCGAALADKVQEETIESHSDALVIKERNPDKSEMMEMAGCQC